MLILSSTRLTNTTTLLPYLRLCLWR